MEPNNTLLLLVVLSISGYAHASSQTQGKQNLSVLLLHSMFPSHYLSVLSIGAELASRGHRVTTLGPTLEGYESLRKTAQNLGVTCIETSLVSRETFMMYIQSAQHEGDDTGLIKWLYNMTKLFKSLKNEHYLVRMRQTVDTLNGTDYDYILSEQATMSILYYLHRKWNTSNIMLLMVILGTSPRYTIPWPYPRVISTFSEDMSSFLNRFVNTALFSPLERLALPFAKSIFVAEEELDLPFSDLFECVLYQPVLYNTVIGIEWPQTVFPLQHYVGPLPLPNPPPLQPDLVEWLDKQPSASVIFISMGTTAVVTKQMAKSFVSLSKEYRVVWSLRESNRHVLNGLSVDHESVYISDWVSQFTLLQHSSIRLAILHCGLNGVQEALYNGVLVLCVPYGADQYDIAFRLEHQSFGRSLTASEVTEEKLREDVDAMLVYNGSHYRKQVNRISLLLRAGGGAKRGADLIELYAEIGYDHGRPSFIRYQWNSIQYYNIDVWIVLVSLFMLLVWGCSKCCFKCCSCCLRRKRDSQKRKKD